MRMSFLIHPSWSVRRTIHQSVQHLMRLMQEERERRSRKVTHLINVVECMPRRLPINSQVNLLEQCLHLECPVTAFKCNETW